MVALRAKLEDFKEAFRALTFAKLVKTEVNLVLTSLMTYLSVRRSC